jgi:hypothetical protein
MIMDSLGDRPVFFAAPSGILARLGLEPWAVRHGLAAKLVPRDLDAPPPPGLIENSEGYGDDWFDVERSLNLMENVYGYRSLRDRYVWADRSTVNIPMYFYFTSIQLADVVSQWEEGTAEQVQWLVEQSQAFYVTGLGGRVAFSQAEDTM